MTQFLHKMSIFADLLFALVENQHLFQSIKTDTSLLYYIPASRTLRYVTKLCPALARFDSPQNIIIVYSGLIRKKK